MPRGGLDSRNLREALRSRPELWVDERVLVCNSSSLVIAFDGVGGWGGDIVPRPLVAAIF